MRNSLRAKIMLIMAAVVLILVSSAGVFSYFTSRDILEEALFNAAKDGAEYNSEILNNWLVGIGNELNAIANTPDMQSMDWFRQLSVLNGILNTHSDYEMMYVVDSTGNARTSLGHNLNLNDRDYFQKAITTGQITYSDPVTSRATGEMIVAIAAPIFRPGHSEPSGVLAVSVTLGYLQELVKDMTISGYGNGWIIDNQQRTIAHPDKKYLGNKEVFKDAGEDLKQIAAKMASSEQGVGTYILNGSTEMMAYAPVTTTGWSVAQTAELNLILAPADIIRNSSIFISFAAIIIGLIIAYFVAGFIVSPIKRVQRVAEALAQGDLSRNVEVTSRTVSSGYRTDCSFNLSD